MEFQQDCPKDEKITALLIFCLKTEKFRSTEVYGAALEGSTIFLCRGSLGCTSMESCQLADLKYAIFSCTGCKTKKLPHSKLFLSMVFKHGLLEGLRSELMWSTVFLEGETQASQIWPTFDKATQLVLFPKALKRPQNIAGPASLLIFLFRVWVFDQCLIT